MLASPFYRHRHAASLALPSQRCLRPEAGSAGSSSFPITQANVRACYSRLMHTAQEESRPSKGIRSELLALTKCWSKLRHLGEGAPITKCGPAWLLFPGYPSVCQVLLKHVPSANTISTHFADGHPGSPQVTQEVRGELHLQALPQEPTAHPRPAGPLGRCSKIEKLFSGDSSSRQCPCALWAEPSRVSIPGKRRP